MNGEQIPEHLRHWPGLYQRRGGDIVDAPLGDVEVARSYPSFPGKGPVVSGLRLTVMTRSLRYRAGEEVRVVHVVEAVEPGRKLYMVGPKPAFGEYIDDIRVTPPPPADVLEPATYNGPVVAGPVVDYNYDVTSYSFDKPGDHRIQWRLSGEFRSNILTIEVVE